MKRSPCQAKKSLPAGGLFFAFFAVLVGVFGLLLGAAGQEDLLLLEDPALAWRAVSLQAVGEESLLVLTDGERGLLLRLDAMGREKARRETDEVPGWAGVRGEVLRLRVDDPQGCLLLTLDPATLEETRRVALPVEPRDLVLFDADDARAGWVAATARNTLVLWQDGAQREVSLSGSGAFLDLGETPARVAADTRVITPDGEREPVEFSRPVTGLLPGGRVLTGEGSVYRLTGEGAAFSFRWEEPVYGPLFFGPARENRLILSKPGGEILLLDETGEPQCSVSPAGTLLALCANGALLRREGALYWSALDLTPSLSPSPGTSPSPEVSPSPLPAVVEGSFLLLEPGTTAAQVRELFRPEAVMLRDTAGIPVTQGRMATGMTANGYTVVVRGDSDGNGVLTAGDLREASRLLETHAAPGTAGYRAADLDNDGELTGDDLLLLRLPDPE